MIQSAGWHAPSRNGIEEAGPAELGRDIGARPGRQGVQDSEADVQATREAGCEWWQGEGRDEGQGALWQGTDPLLRVLAAASPVAPTPLPSSASVQGQTLDAIAQQLIKRLSVGKTATGGAVRLELGVGPFAGTGILLTNEGQRVQVGLDDDADPQSRELVSRLVERLRARGMDAHAS